MADMFREDAVQEYANGDLIFREGDLSQEMYVIQSGQVEIFRENPNVRLALLGRGEFFGEMSLLESLGRSASARAVGGCRILRIQPGGFLVKIRRDPTFAFELLQALSGRIREMNEGLVEILRSEKLTREEIESILKRSQV